ncbi:MAG: hypothetical protein G01um101466_852 [Parcubacteria group bacterium Gr01-1014_66]|nr:MAG: hypothetical protein G01um101466_852 [Parcubacteria group bacterium Gr01-1014_66]
MSEEFTHEQQVAEVIDELKREIEHTIIACMNKFTMKGHQKMIFQHRVWTDVKKALEDIKEKRKFIRVLCAVERSERVARKSIDYSDLY